MRVLIIAMSLLFINCGNDSVKIEKIEIRSVDFGITSIINVGCEDFENYFEKEFGSIVIYDQNIIDDLIKIIMVLKTDSTNYIPDTRAKILLYKNNGKVDTICMSDIGILLNGRSMLINDRLVKFVEENRL